MFLLWEMRLLPLTCVRKTIQAALIGMSFPNNSDPQGCSQLFDSRSFPPLPEIGGNREAEQWCHLRGVHRGVLLYPSIRLDQTFEQILDTPTRCRGD